jgi:integrase
VRQREELPVVFESDELVRRQHLAVGEGQIAGGLTKKAVDAAEKREERYILWDAELKGFGLLVLPSGVRSFLVKYRNAVGRQRRQTIGRYGAFTVDQARAEARAILVAASRGGDPLEERKRVRSAPDVSALLNRYLTEHVEQHNAATTQVDVRSAVEGHLRPRLGHLQVEAVTTRDLAAVHHALRDTPRRANTVLAYASKVFSLAEKWGLRPPNSNPARGIQRFEENERERFLTADELGRPGASIREAERNGLPWAVKSDSKHLPAPERRRSPVNEMAIAAILLLLFTGARLSEILTLEWKHVDLAAGTLSLPDRKGKTRKPHPVNSAALDLVEALKARKRGKRWVLASDEQGKRPVSKSVTENAWQRLRAHADLKDVRLHDLRHTVGTYAGQDGSNAFLISHVLRQRTIAVTARYVNPHADPIREISTRVGDRIRSGLAGGKEG